MKVHRLLLLSVLAGAILIITALSALYLTTRAIAVRGAVTGALDGEPLAGAEVAAGGSQALTDAQGRYLLPAVSKDAVVTVRLDGYHPAQARAAVGSAVAREAQLDIALQPVILQGVVTEAASGHPLPGVTVRVGDRSMVTDAGGAYRFTAVTEASPVVASADGFADYHVVFSGEETLSIALEPNSVTVTVVDDAEANGITYASLTWNGREMSNDGQGQFTLRGVRLREEMAARAEGYLPASLRYEGGPTATLALAANRVSGLIRDQYSGKPMAGVTVTLKQIDNTRTTPSDAAGSFSFRRVRLGAVLTAAGPGYDPAVVTYTGQISFSLSMRPNTLRGIVTDSKTRQALAGATVSVGDVSARTDSNGAYVLSGIPASQPLIVSAAGYDRNRQAVGQATSLDAGLWKSLSVRAIYIPFYLLTVPERVRSLIEFAGQAGMNALVVDIKGDDGYLAYPSTVPLAQEIKAQYAGSMMGLDEVLAMARQRGMYTIARMVVFKDNLLAESRPDLAVKDKRSGGIWDDCGNGTTYWADPFRKEVIDYNAAIAEEAGHLGFDEIQFDYIRFPPACISTIRLANASYAVEPTMETRMEAIATFLAEARRRLKPLGVAMAADTFGWTLMRDDDLAIGQRLENMAQYLDYISPMIYPSTWEPGALGIDYPPAHPYDIVYRTLAYAQNRLKDTNCKLRPWLQDFDDYQARELSYGLRELDEQRRAASDAGATGWMLWNAGGVYTEETGSP